MDKVLTVANDSCLDHFTKEVVSFAGALTYSSKYRETSVALGDVVDKLLDEYGLTDTGATKQTNFTTLCVGLDEVDDLDARQQNFGCGRKVFKFWGRTVNREAAVGHVHCAEAVDVGSDDVEYTSADLVTGGHGDRFAERDHFLATGKAVGRVH